MTACVRTPGADGGREPHFAEFPTTVAGLLALRDWLAAHGVTQVMMEATGVYWKPVWAILEDEFELMLVNARHVKQVPGRKTDMSDAAWLCQLAEAGLLRASFVPPKPIRDAQQPDALSQDADPGARSARPTGCTRRSRTPASSLTASPRDILGVSGRAMLDALVAGTTDPEVLAELARGKLRKKMPALREALEGRFDRMHALWIGSILAHIDFLDEQIDQLTVAIGEQIAPFERAVELLCTITGVQRRTAEAIIAEIGVDMSIFPTAKELASWAGQCPGNDQSAGKRRSGKTRRGSKWLDWALEEAALAATRSKDTYLAAQYARQAAPRPQESARRRQALDHRRLLAHAHHRPALRRPRRRLLPAPRPRKDHQAPRRPARTPRPRRHAAGGQRRVGLKRIFLSVTRPRRWRHRPRWPVRVARPSRPRGPGPVARRD